VSGGLVSGGLAAVEQPRVQPGNPVRAMLAQRLAALPAGDPDTGAPGIGSYVAG
jgi:hypothetical protein